MRPGLAPRVLALLIGLLCATLTSATDGSPTLGVDAEIRPLPDDTYLCAIELSDLATGEPIARPQIHLQSGESASVRIGSPDASTSEAVLEIEVTIDSPKGTARLRISSIQGDVESKLHEFRIHFAK